MLLLAAALLALAGEDKAETPPWKVDAPPGAGRKVNLDLSEGTWMSVDVAPDGQTLVFDLLGDLYLLPSSGGSARRLTEGLSWDMQPVFSPDGQQIAFTSDRGGGDNLWVIPVSGGEAKAVTKETFRLVNGPAWTPDGAALVGRKHFTGQRSLGSGEIWRWNLAGGDGLPLTTKPNDQTDVNEPALSPDGRYLYYSQDVSGGPTFQYNKDPNGTIYAIQRLDLWTGEQLTLTGGAGGAFRPTPSPDGRRLAFGRRVRSKTVLVVKDLASGHEREIWDGLERDMQETWAIHGVYPHFSWLPGSEGLVLWAQGRLWKVPLNGAPVGIPFQVRDEREVREVVRSPVPVAEADFPVRMVRMTAVAPDASVVVYEALGKLWVRELPDGSPRRLTRQEDHLELDPSFSADGKRVVFATWDDEELGTLREVPLKGGKEKVLLGAPGHYRTPRYAPDGERLVYQKLAGGYLRSGLWSADPGLYLLRPGAEPVKLPAQGDNPHFGPDPDAVYAVGGGEKRTLLRIGLTDRTVREVARTEMGVDLRISPDGRWLSWQEDYVAWLAPWADTGRVVDLSSTTTALPRIKASLEAGNQLQFADGALWSVLGPTLAKVPVAEALRRSAAGEEPLAPETFDLGFRWPQARAEGTAALVGATLVTMKGDEILRDGTIVWRGDRVLAVGPRAETPVPAGAQVFEGRGRVVTPGLIDAHAHGAQAEDGIVPEQNWIQLSNLSFGVTTLHDPSNDTAAVFAAAERQRAGTLLAPRIFSTGTILYGAKGPGYTAKVESLEDAKAHLRRLQAQGAVSVKSYNLPRRDQRQMVLQAARELGMNVVPEGGSTFMHNLTQVVDGHTTVEHALPVRVPYADVLQLWSATSVGYTPTLGVAYGGQMGEHYWYSHTLVWDQPRLATFVPREVVDPAARRSTLIPEEEYNHDEVAAGARRLAELGVPVSIGAHGQREGLAAHWELWMFVQGGMTPHQALRAGTAGPAVALGLDRHLGTLEPGKLADFLVFEADVLTDIRRSVDVDLTVLGGRVYTASSLEEVWPGQSKPLPLAWALAPADPGQDDSANCSCSHP